MAGHEFVEQLRVADVAVHELHLVTEQRLDVLEVAGVGQRVEHRHMRLGVVVDDVVHEIRSDEAAASGHDDVLGNKRLSHGYHSSRYPDWPSAESFFTAALLILMLANNMSGNGLMLTRRRTFSNTA